MRLQSRSVGDSGHMLPCASCAPTSRRRVRGLALWASSARLLWGGDYPIGLPDEAVELVLVAFRAARGNDEDPGLEVVAPSVARVRRCVITEAVPAVLWPLTHTSCRERTKERGAPVEVPYAPAPGSTR
jgi:hypothetical protein